MIALVIVILKREIIVFIPYFYQFEIERLWMSIGNAQSPPFGSLISIAIFNSVKRFLYILIYFHIRNRPSMPHTHVNNKKWFGTKILGKL